MRKSITFLVFFLLATAVTGGVGYHYFGDTHSPALAEVDGMTIRQVGEGVYKQYENLEDLEQEAELVIIGKPIKNLKSLKQSQTKTSEHDPLGEFWVDTPFKVNKVIKGDFDKKEITVAQHIFFDQDQDQVLTPPGYSPLIENAQYVLFLAKSEFGVSGDQEFAWNIMSYNHGKYNLDGNDTIEDDFSDEKQLKLKKLVKKKYK